MIINEISLKNIRSHVESEISFSPGINVIVGNTGSGKSSILMSIEYALFGKIGEGTNEGKMLLRRGENSGRISLVFTENGREIRVMRGLKRVKDAVRNDDSMNSISVDGREVDLQNRSSDISTFVSKSLSMKSDPLKTFEAVVYIKQDELKGLVFDTTQKKQEYIDDTLQVGKYALVYDGMRSLMIDLQNEEALLKKEIEFSVGDKEIIETKSKLLDIEKNIKKLSDDINLLESKSDELAKARRAYEEKLEAEKDLQLKFNVLRSLIDKEAKELEKLKESVKDLQVERDLLYDRVKDMKQEDEGELLNKLHEIDKLADACNKEKDIRIKEMHELQMRISVLNDRKGKIEEELKKYIKYVDEISKLISEKKAALDEAKVLLSDDEINAKIEQIKEVISDITADMERSISSGICVFCGSSIIDRQHVEKEFKGRINGYNQTISKLQGLKSNISKISKASLEKELFSLEKDMLNAKTTIDNLTKESDSIHTSDLSSQLEKFETELDKLKQEQTSLSDEKLEIARKLEEISKSRALFMKLSSIDSEIEQRLKLIGDKESNIEKNRSDLKDLNFDPSIYAGLMDELKLVDEDYNKVISQLAESRKEKAMLEERRSEENARLEEIKSKLETKEKANSKLVKLEKAIKMLSNLREDIRSIREYVRNRFIGDFRSLFQTKFYELRNETDYAVDIDNNYNVIIKSDGEVFESKSLSGGEKTIVALAYRISLSSIAAKLGGISRNEIFIMDEPTSGLDKKDVSSLADSITKITGVNQIIIVTHDDNLKNIADNMIRVEKKEGVSVVI
ncbi:MAG: SMC family ATPase [Candidatus Parvarchaeota archaeon]|nr:SMC family ATPase [Candidatus Parvarchaeota archaeon]